MTDQLPDEAPRTGRSATLDAVDQRIVAALRADGRMSMRALAEAVHISRASAYTRVERLETSGVITGYVATVDPARVGAPVSAYVYLKIAQSSWQEVRRLILGMPEVDHCALIAGDHDLVLLVRSSDIGALREFIFNRLQRMPDVVSTETVLIFDEIRPRPDTFSA